MTKLMLVDDEIHAVQGIKAAVDWERLGITEVFTADNITQAKELFDANSPIDILLCDIEMPMGNGLELLEWVREHYPDTESIFLTCHADFAYAKQAVQLGSFDYLLKPVPIPELEEIISKALAKKAENAQKSTYSQYGQYWVQHQPMLIERFWLDLLNRSIPSSQQAIMKAADERNILFEAEMTFLPVLITVKQWHKSLNTRDEKVMEYALRNISEEILLNGRDYGQILSLNKDGLLLLLSVETWTTYDLDVLKQQCGSLFHSCRQYCYCDISCYIAYPECPHKLPALTDRLLQMDRDNVTYDSLKVLQSEEAPSLKALHEPELFKWSLILQEGAVDKLIGEISKYLDELSLKGGINANQLHQFHQDFLQMVYSFLQGKGIHANRLFHDEQSVDKAQHAARSIKDTINWCHQMICKATEHVQAAEKTESVVDKVSAYIAQNLDSEMTREEIARQIYLNPDYLDRMFKKNKGVTVTEYVVEQRISMAKQLLCNTNLPVSTIATQVGITNFSYFSRIFKKYTNQNPMEFGQAYIDKE